MEHEIPTSDIEVEDPELPRFDDFLAKRKEDNVKKEKTAAQLADARAAKAKKAEERKAALEDEVDDEDAPPAPAKDDPDDDEEDSKGLPQPDGELAELLAKKKADKKKADEEEIKLKGKEKPKTSKPDDEPEPEVEAAAETEEEDEEERKNGKAFAALSRREKELTEREKSLSERERERERLVSEANERVKALEAQYTQKAKEVEERERQIQHGIEQARRRGPNELLKAFGWTVADAVEEVTSDGTPHGAMIKGLKFEVDQRVNALQQQLEQARNELTRYQKEREEREAEHTVQQYKNSVFDFVRKHADEYELINRRDQLERVWATIENHFAKHQVFPEFKDAADVVERALEQEAEDYLQSKKIAARIKPQTAPTETVKVPDKRDPAGARAKAPSVTLTDSLAANPASDDDDDLMLGMDRDEALKRLLKRKGRA